MNTKKIILGKDYDIVDGPPVDKVVDLLRYAYTASRIAAGFKFAIDDDVAGEMRNVTMSSLSHESGSEWHWLIKGYCDIFFLEVQTNVSLSFEGYYDAKARKGWVRFS
jgi:hypothetical protein